MKANCWMGKKKVQRRGRAGSEDPELARRHRADHLDGDLRLRPSPLQRLHAHDGEGRHPRPRVHGRGRRGRPGGEEPQGRRPRGGAVPDRVRHLRAVPAESCSRCCENSNPNAWMAEKLWGHSPAGVFGYSHLTGGYAGGQAEYARVPFADVGPLKVPERPDRRAGAVPLRHLPDRLHGRGDVRHQAGRRDRGLGRGPGRPVRHRQRLAARRRAGDRHRPLPLPAADGARAGGRDRDDQLRGGRRRRRRSRS